MTSSTRGASTSDDSIRRGHAVRLSGVLSNSLPALFFGSQVFYEVQRPGSSTWRPLATRLVSTSGSSNVRVTLSRRGTYRFRVRYMGTDDFLASTSRVVSVRVR